MPTRTTVAALALTALATSPALAQEPTAERDASRPRAEVLVLGVYHMNNPGRDVFSTEADDVLSPERQSQIAEVVAVLEEFRPTKIAVEAGFNDERVAERYAAYVAGEHELTRNETEQLGFRLARRLSHETIYPVDVDGEFPYPRVVKFAQATGREAEFEALQEEFGRSAEEFASYLASHTVLETLLYMNDDERVAADVGSYLRLAEFSESWDWAGADLVSDWFRRNMRIYGNVLQLVGSPDERVLVIYGAGHLGWLQYAFGGNPEIRLRKLAELAGPGG